jgi:hypothetical protein
MTLPIKALRKILIFSITVGGVAILGCLCVMYAQRDRPVFATLGVDVISEHGRQVLNPFRERASEGAAEVFLEELKAGRCQQTLSRLDESEGRAERICASEKQYPLGGWTLAARGVDKGRVVLRYEVTRRGEDRTVQGPFWIWVSPGTGGYRVTGYDVWY